MNLNKFGINENEIKLPKVLAVCTRGTQTKEDSPKNSTACKDFSSECCGSSDKGSNSKDIGHKQEDESSINIFEFSQIIQDPDHPESITIIKDTFSEESRDHSSKSPDASANRYRYCREVIKPFIDCPKYLGSDDEVIKEALDSARKDFADFDPCFKPYPSKDTESCSKDSKLDNKKPKNSLKKRKDPDDNPAFLCCEKLHLGAQPASASSSSETFLPVIYCEKPAAKPKAKKNTKEDSSTLISCCGKSGDISQIMCSNMDNDSKKSSTSKNPTVDDYDEPYDPCRKPKCPRNAVCPEGIKPCKKPRNEPKVAPAPFCADDSGPKCHRKLSTGCENENDLKEKAKKSKQACKGGGSGAQLPPTTYPPPQKTIMQAHCEALQTLQTVASCALCKVCQATKETVSLIRTESAKQLEKLKTFSSECEDVCEDSLKKASKKKSTCSSSGVKKVSNIFGKNNLIEDMEQLNKVDPEEFLHEMVEKMDSTVSMISDKIDFDSIANILKSVNGNVFDQPQTPPRDVVHHFSNSDLHTEKPPKIKQAPASASVFTVIKSKIFSMFSDSKKERENPESSDENDED